MFGMRRREFITLLSGAATAWPVSVRAQHPRERTKRIGVFMPGTADDSEYQARNAAFLLGLGALGWDISRSLRIEYRWGRGDTERYRTIAARTRRAGAGCHFGARHRHR